MYNPFVVRLENKTKIDLSKLNKEVVFSSIINQPINSNGFHYFIHRTKDTMSITNKLYSLLWYYNCTCIITFNLLLSRSYPLVPLFTIQVYPPSSITSKNNINILLVSHQVSK